LLAHAFCVVGLVFCWLFRLHCFTRGSLGHLVSNKKVVDVILRQDTHNGSARSEYPVSTKTRAEWNRSAVNAHAVAKRKCGLGQHHCAREDDKTSCSARLMSARFEKEILGNRKASGM
jgi:hypothetical protein